jgi:CheY-like chemotaxis protein
MPIIVVDDEPVTRRLMGTVLRKHNFEVIELGSGKDALDFLQGHGPVDLIVSDVLMPEMDGFDMLRFVRADERFKKVPVVLATSLNDPESVLKGIELGAQDYVTKPVSPSVLVAKVKRILSPEKPRILIVECETATRAAIVQIVERVGYAALDAMNGEEALSMLKSNRVVAVVSDCRLSGMTGIELLKTLKLNYPNLPVVLMTGSSESFGARQIMLAGADGFITKPFHNVEIVRKLRALTGQPV